MDKFWERYIQSRPAPGESKGAFDAFAAASRDPEPRNMAQGGRIGFKYGTSAFDIHTKKEAAFKAYKDYKKSYYSGRQRYPIITFREFLPIYAKENYADGGEVGQLVQNTADGSRPGYQGEEFSLKKDLKTVPPKIRKRFLKVTKYLEELIPKLNASEKYVTKEQVSSMVEKKFGIKPKYKTTYPNRGFPSDKIGYTKKVNQFEPKRYPVMRNLDSVETKIENTLKNMLIEDKPLNNFWYRALQERTGLVEQTITAYINESPTFKAIKDQGALSLKTRFNKPDSHKFLKELSFSKQLTQALEMEKGMPRFTGMGAEKGYTYSPKFKVMEFAKRNWHANRGKGAVQFFHKNGKRIDWAYGVELPYRGVSFSYGGKNYTVNKLTNIELLKRDFPKVYEKQTAINNLRVQEIDDPLNKGKKISIEKLVRRNQVNAYKWSPRTSTFDILHGPKGVKGEPFTNLNFNTRDINQLEMGINRDTTLSQTKKNNLIKSINKLAGSGDPEAIIKRQVALTGDIKSGKITSYEDMKNKVLAGWCSKGAQRVKKDEGGRIGFAGDCPDGEKITNMKNAAAQLKQHDRYLRGLADTTPFADNAAAKALASKMAKSGTLLRRAGRLAFGPMTLWGEPLFEGAFVAHDILGTGTPWKEAVAKSLWAKPAIAMGLLKPADQQYEEALWQVQNEEGEALMMDPYHERVRTPIKRFMDNSKKIDKLNKLYKLKQTSYIMGPKVFSQDERAAKMKKADETYNNYLESLGGAEGITKIKNQISEDQEAYDTRVAALETERQGWNEMIDSDPTDPAAPMIRKYEPSLKPDSLEEPTKKMQDLMYQKYGKKWAGPTVGRPGTSGESKEKWIKDPNFQEFFPSDFHLSKDDYNRFVKEAVKNVGVDRYSKNPYRPYEDQDKWWDWKIFQLDAWKNKQGKFDEASIKEKWKDLYKYNLTGTPTLAGGGRAGYTNGGLTRTVAPDSGPMSQGLRSLYINDKDY